MRIIEMRPELTPWKYKQHRRVSSWSFGDFGEAGGLKVRQVFHYNTLMLEYLGTTQCWACHDDRHHGERECERTSPDNTTWIVSPMSIGHGSVGDQGGMNQLMGYKRTYRDGAWVFTTDYGDWVYRRDERGGGARIEHDGIVVVD